MPHGVLLRETAPWRTWQLHLWDYAALHGARLCAAACSHVVPRSAQSPRQSACSHQRLATHTARNCCWPCCPRSLQRPALHAHRGNEASPTGRCPLCPTAIAAHARTTATSGRTFPHLTGTAPSRPSSVVSLPPSAAPRPAPSRLSPSKLLPDLGAGEACNGLDLEFDLDFDCVDHGVDSNTRTQPGTQVQGKAQEVGQVQQQQQQVVELSLEDIELASDYDEELEALL